MLHYPTRVPAGNGAAVTASSRPLVKLIDFGKSRFGSNWAPGERRGPAVSHHSNTQSRYNPTDDEQAMTLDEYKRADLWSVGATLYIPLVCAWPEQSKDPALDESLHNFERLSDGCKQLLRGLLSQDEHARATIADVLQCPWIRGDSSGACLLYTSPSPRDRG